MFIVFRSFFMISKFSIVSDKKLKIISVKVFSLKDKVFVKYLISPLLCAKIFSIKSFFLISIDKKLISKGTLDPSSIVLNYYLLSSNYRELHQPELADKYVDSCFQFLNEKTTPININYLKFEKGLKQLNIWEKDI